MNKQPFLLLLFCLIQLFQTGCDGQTSNSGKQKDATQKKQEGAQEAATQKFVEGKDYTVFERVRMMDKQGFTQPAEAYSLLLPKGWQQQGEVIWVMPGQPCAGNYTWLRATSPDKKYSLDFFPNKIFSWSSNQQTLQWNLANPSNSPYCSYAQPVSAEQYLRSAFVKEIGNPQVLKVEANNSVAAEMQVALDKGKAELMQYGASGVQHYSSAINAEVKWNDGTEGFIILAAALTEIIIPNIYTGGYDKSFTTSVTKQTVFRYPSGEKEKAASQFAVIMGSMHSNPEYITAINSFWLQVRQEGNRAHWEKIRLMDEQTRQIGERAIQQGNQRLKDMDNQMRSWEAKQSSQDRVHTEFIKTIREVENFRDETGKYEMVSGYNHAWSRGDGTSFVLSDNPNFDAAFVFKDQAWKPMKKVD